jgi:hypothetical protein
MSVPERYRYLQVVEMQNAAELADPLVEIRDVVESFRTSHLVLPDWDTVLGQAMAALSGLGSSAETEALFAVLLPNLRLLMAEGLGGAPQIVDEVAQQVADALAQTRVPGIPAPEDDDWSFEAANAS